MAIKVVTGDLLEAAENFIVHQVNTTGKMGSGIALQVKKKYPFVYEGYIQRCKDNVGNRRDLLGKVYAEMVGDRKYIVNLFGQLDYGYDGKRYTSYDALYDGLKSIKDIAVEYEMSVAIPYKLGSDRGGADWDIVYMIIEKIFKDYEVAIYQLEEK